MQEREILFRGKRKDNGEWVEGFYYKAKYYSTDNKLCDYITTPYPEECGRRSDHFIIDPETRGEYTGLTDKNKKKVFEGDILYDEYNECNCLVTFDEGSFCTVEDNVCQSIWSCDMTTFEVIGNIHDNPELIKE